MSNWVKVTERGVWHIQDGTMPWTVCGKGKPRVRSYLNEHWHVSVDWMEENTEPQEPLCRRCERSRR